MYIIHTYDTHCMHVKENEKRKSLLKFENICAYEYNSEFFQSTIPCDPLSFLCVGEQCHLVSQDFFCPVLTTKIIVNGKIKLFLVNTTESNTEKPSSRQLSLTVEHFQKQKTKRRVQILRYYFKPENNDKSPRSGNASIQSQRVSTISCFYFQQFYGKRGLYSPIYTIQFSQFSV